MPSSKPAPLWRHGMCLVYVTKHMSAFPPELAEFLVTHRAEATTVAFVPAGAEIVMADVGQLLFRLKKECDFNILGYNAEVWPPMGQEQAEARARSGFAGGLQGTFVVR